MSLIHWWPLIGDLTDRCGGGAMQCSVASFVDGKIGKCIKITGGDVQVPNPFIGMENWSIAFWFRDDGSGDWKDFICWSDNKTRLEIYKTGGQWIWYCDSTTSGSLFPSGTVINTTIQTNVWYHITIVKKGTKAYLYINGNIDNPITSTSAVTFTGASTTLHFNSRANTSYGAMSLNDVRCYNHALSKKEVKELSKALVLHYDFNTPLFKDTTNVTSNPALWSPYTDYWHVVTYTPTGVKLVRPAGSSATCLALSHSSFTSATQVGTTWTFSCFLYKNGRPWKANCQSCEPQYGYSDITWESHDNGYYRCTFTNSFAHSHTSWVIHNHLFGDVAIGEECELRYIQFEKSDHATPYTDSTRPGMIVDCSGLGNDAMLKSPSYYKFMKDSACGSGSLYSTGDPGAYIKTAFVPNFIQGTGTICLWYKKDANAFNYNNGDFLIATQHSSGYYFGATNSTSVWHNGATHSKFYIDGVERGSGRITDTNWHFYVFTGVNLSSWNTFALHCHGDDAWLYRGQIGDFRIYNTNLTTNDIMELYHTSWQSNQIGASFVRSVSEGSGTVKMPKNGDVNCKAIYETGILPVEYEALDGLYFDRGPCINTGVTINDATKPIKVAVDITAKHVTVNSCVLGCGNSLWRGPVMLNCCRYYLEAGVDGYGSDTTVPEGVYEDGERFVYHATIQPNRQTFYKNGTPIQNIPSRTLITSTYPIYIGGFNAPGGLTASDNFLGWVHYVEIEYGTIRRQMVPCKRRSDGALGMYDMVGGQFYTAATTGSWTKGSSTVSQSRTGCLCVGEIHEC